MLRLILLGLILVGSYAARQPPVKRIPTLRKLKSSELIAEERSRSERLLKFIDSSPEPFHVVDSAIIQLKKQGFVRLKEDQSWKSGVLIPGGKYYFTRNGSSFIAFVVGGLFKPGNAYKIIGAHVDSPTLKLKPRSKRDRHGGLVQLNVECYGGGLWHTFFDRDLSIAGRVLVQVKDRIQYKLVKVDRPLLRIPNLCIHLRSPDERDAFKVNKEDHLVPILCEQVDLALSGGTKAGTEVGTGAGASEEREQWISDQPAELLQVLAKELKCNMEDIIDFELSLFDVQKSSLSGANEEFVVGSRLDNLASCFVALEAIADWASSPTALAKDDAVSVIALFDHEEVGSQSNPGAGSNLMRDAVARIASGFGDEDGDRHRCGLGKSFAISMDMAHAVHPNYAAKHEKSHSPHMNSGVVIKHNSNQRYATNGVSAFLIRELARRRLGVPIQEFVVRNDCPCGSTIGPIISANTGIRCIDLGMPMLSMHSIREMMGASDLTFAYKLFSAFFGPEWKPIDEQLIVDSD